MSFPDGSGGSRERGFNRGRGKSLAVGRGDDGWHQASDEAHASFFSYRGRGRSSFGNSQCFYCQKYGYTIKFCRKKIEYEKKKELSFMHEGEKRVRMILSFSHVVLKKLNMMKCCTSTVDVTII